jgi:hypothetical protein
MAGFSGSGATDSGTNFLELCLIDFFVHRGEQTCLWNLGTSYRRQALSVCEGWPAQPPDRKGTLVTTTRMEVRSVLGPAITRAGGILIRLVRRPQAGLRIVTTLSAGLTIRSMRCLTMGRHYTTYYRAKYYIPTELRHAIAAAASSSRSAVQGADAQNPAQHLRGGP